MIVNKPTGLQHIGLPVKDFDRSLSFYSGLGFETAALKKNMNGYHCAMIQLGNCMIEIYESLAPDKSGVASRKDGKIDHFALVCSELDGLFNECVALGYEIVTNGIESTEIWENGGRYFIIEGPDGEKIEFAKMN
jgi:lactoylglutathione lyase